MQKRQLADTDIFVSPIGLGTVKLGRNQGVKYPQQFALPSDKEALGLLHLALDLGINLIDTAPAYGSSEERLGKLLNTQRQEWVIATKVGEEFNAGVSSFHFDASAVRTSIERSLKRFNTDYLDIVQVHSDGNDVEIIQRYGILEQLQDLKSQGLIRAFGMSTKTLAGGLLAAEKSDVVMLSYNPQHTDEQGVLDYCATHNKAAFIKKAFASGHLCNSAEQQNPIDNALEFIFKHAGVTSVITGTINAKHLQQNVAAAQKILANLKH